MPTLSIHADVSIPDNIIHALSLKPDTKLAFERLGDGIIMHPAKPNKISQVDEGSKILGYADSTVTLEEMDAAIAKGAVQSMCQEN